MKIFISFFTIVFLLTIGMTAFAQPTAVIKVVGASPRDVEADTMDIFDRIATSLPNVGVGSPVYLAGNPGDEEINGWAWELDVPDGSESSLNADDVGLVTFLADVAGTFMVRLTVSSDSGQSEAVSMPVNSSVYVGVGGIVEDPRFPECGSCHGDEAAEWRSTNHSIAFQKGLNGEKGDYFAAYCTSCHVIGYDVFEGADNDGFDDMAREEEWVFPDTLYEGVWDEFVENYPQTASRANIQCESCHGPGSAHRGNVADNRIASSLDVKVCAQCHDAGTYHTFPLSWSYSGHNGNYTRAGSTTCQKCHGGAGFIDNLNEVPDEEMRTEASDIGCVSCHDPHEDSGENHQLRTVEPYTLLDGVEVDFGYGNLCVNCHHSRRNAEEYVTEYHRHYGPHHSNQGDMVRGTNAINYGLDIPSSPHYMAVDNVCIGCHMADSPVTGEGEDEVVHYEIGSHSWKMANDEGLQNVAACIECHEGIESFESIMADEDFDGDGDVEGVTAEIEGMLQTLALLLPPMDEAEVVVDTNYTAAQLKAAYNYFFVEDDGSHGIHNANYAFGILLAATNDILGVEDLDNALPVTWSLGSPYPNPFNPSTAFNYTIGRDSHVAVKLFDLAGREVMTIAEGDMKVGSYKGTINLYNQSSGIYVITMASEDFSATKKVVLLK